LKKSFSHIFRVGTIGVLLVLVCGSCTFVNKMIHRDKEFYVHPVKWEGETLSILAKWYTGSLDNWKAIAKVNPVLDPNRIIIGNEIRIPTSLLITRNPMPKSFLAGFGLEKKIKLPASERNIRSSPAGVPASDKIQPPEVPNQQIPPAVIPQTRPEIKPVPGDMVEKPVLPDKEALPLTATPPQLEKKQNPPETDRPLELSDKPQPAGPSVQPKSEKKPPQPKVELPPEKEELPLFGPKGYSD